MPEDLKSEKKILFTMTHMQEKFLEDTKFVKMLR